MGDTQRGSSSAAPLSWLASNGGAFFFLSLTLVNLGNFVFHAVVSRLLGPDSYGALSALLGLMLTLAVPVSAMQAAVTKRVAERRSPGNTAPNIRRLTLHTAGVGGAV